MLYIYKGLLEDYSLNSKGEIETLILSSAARTLTGQLSTEHSNSPKLTNEIISLDSFHSIDGDYFILKYAEIVNLNIFFITVADLKNFHLRYK